MKDILSRATQVRCLICDVDGVLTDGRLYINIHGEETKAFHVQDGLGLKLLMAAGIEVAVITATTNTIIDSRMNSLGITHYFKGQIDKQTAFLALQTRLKLDLHAFAYIGDDLPDMPLIQQVGLGIAVANAVDEVKHVAHWQTKHKGGKGAVREACDFILKSQGQFDIALQRYLAP